MEGVSTGDARRLAQLEAEERSVSSRRRRLQDRIDFIRSGRSPDAAEAAAQLERLLEEEREASARRRELHLEIDTLRVKLGREPGPRERPPLLGG